jgi:hypothetical protein
MSALAERPPDQAESAASRVGVDAGVIREARRLQRRRRATVALVMILMAFGVVVAFGPGGRSVRPAGPAHSQPSPVLALDSGALFSQPPYMGVSCGVANSIACDRIGLTVWLRRPARAVTAMIAGSAFRLDNPTWSDPGITGSGLCSRDSYNLLGSPPDSACQPSTAPTGMAATVQTRSWS